MTDPDVLAFWEWEPGWKLVRPLTSEALECLYFRLEPEAGYQATDIDEVQEAHEWNEDGSSCWSFLLGPSDQVVVMAQVTAEPGYHALSLSPGLYGARDALVDGDRKYVQQWNDGVLRLFGMSASLPGIRINQREFPWSPPSVAEADSVLREILEVAKNQWKKSRADPRDLSDEEFLGPILEHVVRGRPLRADDEVLFLLGLPPAALCSPMSALRSIV